MIKIDGKFQFRNLTNLEQSALKKMASIVSKKFNVNLKNTHILFDKQPKLQGQKCNAYIKTFENYVIMRFFKSKTESVPFTNFVHSAGHEFVHVKQYIKDGLYGSVDGVKYKGKSYTLKQMEDDYPNLPWEVEAFAEQDDLLSRFAATCNKQMKEIFLKEYHKING